MRGTPIFLPLPITTVPHRLNGGHECPSTFGWVFRLEELKEKVFFRCARWAACFIACLSCFYFYFCFCFCFCFYCAAHRARHATSAGADAALVRLLPRRLPAQDPPPQQGQFGWGGDTGPVHIQPQSTWRVKTQASSKLSSVSHRFTSATGSLGNCDAAGATPPGQSPSGQDHQL